MGTASQNLILFFGYPIILLAIMMFIPLEIQDSDMFGFILFLLFVFWSFNSLFFFIKYLYLKSFKKFT